MHPPPSPARANFTLITECTPESSGCNSVHSVGSTFTYILHLSDVLSRRRNLLPVILVHVVEL